MENSEVDGAEMLTNQDSFSTATEDHHSGPFAAPSACRDLESKLPSAAGRDSADNALALTVVDLFKTEVLHPKSPWRGIEDVNPAVLSWIDSFENKPLRSSVATCRRRNTRRPSSAPFGKVGLT